MHGNGNVGSSAAGGRWLRTGWARAPAAPIAVLDSSSGWAPAGACASAVVRRRSGWVPCAGHSALGRRWAGARLRFTSSGKMATRPNRRPAGLPARREPLFCQTDATRLMTITVQALATGLRPPVGDRRQATGLPRADPLCNRAVRGVREAQQAWRFARTALLPDGRHTPDDHHCASAGHRLATTGRRQVSRVPSYSAKERFAVCGKPSRPGGLKGLSTSRTP
jgi:hypothetical protein